MKKKRKKKEENSKIITKLVFSFVIIEDSVVIRCSLLKLTEPSTVRIPIRHDILYVPCVLQVQNTIYRVINYFQQRN